MIDERADREGGQFHLPGPCIFLISFRFDSARSLRASLRSRSRSPDSLWTNKDTHARWR